MTVGRDPERDHAPDALTQLVGTTLDVQDREQIVTLDLGVE